MEAGFIEIRPYMKHEKRAKEMEKEGDKRKDNRSVLLSGMDGYWVLLLRWMEVHSGTGGRWVLLLGCSS